MEWTHSISNCTHESQYVVIDDVERCFKIQMTNREYSLIHSEKVKEGYDLLISTDDYSWRKIKHAKRVKELKAFVESEYPNHR